MDILATTPPPAKAESNQQLADEITLLAAREMSPTTAYSS
jgi:hypothetical protein